MDKLEKVQTGRNLSSLSNKVSEIGKVIYHVNQLSPFRISDEDIIEWSKSIEEIVPEIEIDDLKFLLRCFKTGEENYDNKVGIQNIFLGLKNRFGRKYIKSQMVY